MEPKSRNVPRRSRPASGKTTATPRPPQPKRTNRRSERTIDHILRTAAKLLRLHGAQKVSMLMVSEQAGVSRGTLYRYFPSKVELLEELAIFFRRESDRKLREVTEPYSDPKVRFERFVEYLLGNQEAPHSAQLLEVEPEFVLTMIRTGYAHLKGRVIAVLEAVFDSWDAALGRAVDRDLLAGLFVRYALSELVLVGAEPDLDYSGRIKAMVELLRAAGPMF